jgi:hypothetical protein
MTARRDAEGFLRQAQPLGVVVSRRVRHTLMVPLGRGPRNQRQATFFRLVSKNLLYVK